MWTKFFTIRLLIIFLLLPNCDTPHTLKNLQFLKHNLLSFISYLSLPGMFFLSSSSSSSHEQNLLALPAKTQLRHHLLCEVLLNSNFLYLLYSSKPSLPTSSTAPYTILGSFFFPLWLLHCNVSFPLESPIMPYLSCAWHIVDAQKSIDVKCSDW